MEIDCLWERAQREYREGKYIKAIEDIDKFINTIVDEDIKYDVLLLKAQCQRKINQDDAENTLMMLINTYPKQYKPYVELSSFYRHKKRSKEEIEILEKGKEATKSEDTKGKINYDHHITRALGFAYYSRKNYREALKIYDQLKKAYPADISLKIELALCYNRMFMKVKAFEIINALITTDVNNKTYHQYKRDMNKFRMEYAQALEENEYCILAETINPTPYLIEKLSLQYLRGDYETVIKEGKDFADNIEKDKNLLKYSYFLFYYGCALRLFDEKDKDKKNKNKEDFEKYNEKYLRLAKDKSDNEEYKLTIALFNVKNFDNDIKDIWNKFGEKTEYAPLIYYYYKMLLETNDRDGEKRFLEKPTRMEFIKIFENRETLDNVTKKKGLLDSDEQRKDLKDLFQALTVNDVTYTKDRETDAESYPYMSMTSFGKFGEVTETLLGKGGFAEVYLQEYKVSGVKNAVKYLKSDDENINSKIQELKKEVYTMFDFIHPNIVLLKGFDIDKLAITLEYMEGGDLTKLLKNTEKELPHKFKIHLIKGITEGLYYLHEIKKKIHGDLKSQNVLLDKNYYNDMNEEEYPVPKLSDFGLTDSEGTSLGGYSPRFTPPEILNPFYEKRELKKQGKSTDDIVIPHNKSADIFSYGMLLYEIASRKIPFNFLNNPEEANEFIMKAGEDEILLNVYDDEDVDCPNSVKELITECIKINPEERPTIEEIQRRVKDITPEDEN